MAQSSGPISQGTTSERQFTDVQWRNLFGDEAGVLSDLDGTAYALNLSGGGDVVTVGSATQVSLSKVAGFFHSIPQSSPEPITIPAASGSTRTDVIALRYDPAYTGLPGPVRLVRIIGSSSSIPSYDAAAPGVEELPLWAITRAVGQTLAQATTQRMFPRIAPAMELGSLTVAPSSSPLGTSLRIGNVMYYRRLNASNIPEWGRSDNHIFHGSNHLAAFTLVSGTATYTDIATVTATTFGGVCTAEFVGSAYNAGSGQDRTMEWRVIIDSTTLGSFTGVPIPAANPSTDTGSDVVRAASWSSTPTAGSHTWKLQARASAAGAVEAGSGLLRIVEK